VSEVRHPKLTSTFGMQGPWSGRRSPPSDPGARRRGERWRGLVLDEAALAGFDPEARIHIANELQRIAAALGEPNNV